RNSAWNTVPAAARAAPTVAASSTRGIRSWNRITSSAAGTSPGRDARSSCQPTRRSSAQGETATEPTATPTTTAATSPPARAGTTSRRRAGLSIAGRPAQASREQVRMEVGRQLHEAVGEPGSGTGDERRVDDVDTVAGDGGQLA